MSTEPTSGNEPITESTDTEAIEAQEAADAAAADLAEERLAPAPADLNEAYKEYDAVGKGEDYEPKGSPTLEAAEDEPEPVPTRQSKAEEADAKKASKSKG